MRKSLWLIVTLCIFIGGVGGGRATQEGGLGWISWKISYGLAARNRPDPEHVRKVARRILREFYRGRAIVYVPYAQADTIFIYSLRYLYDPHSIEKKDDIEGFLKGIEENNFHVEVAEFAPFFISKPCAEERCKEKIEVDDKQDIWGLSYLYAEAARQFGYPVSAVLLSDDGQNALNIFFHRDCEFKEQMVKELDNMKNIIRDERKNRVH